MAEAESIGVARAKTFGTAFAVAGLLAGGVGLFAGGLWAMVGTIAAVVSVAGVCAANMAEQLEAHRDCLVDGWQPPAAAEPAAIAISQEVAVSLPDRCWVASLDTPRPGGRTR